MFFASPSLHKISFELKPAQKMCWYGKSPTLFDGQRRLLRGPWNESSRKRCQQSLGAIFEFQQSCSFVGRRCQRRRFIRSRGIEWKLNQITSTMLPNGLISVRRTNSMKIWGELSFVMYDWSISVQVSSLSKSFIVMESRINVYSTLKHKCFFIIMDLYLITILVISCGTNFK